MATERAKTARPPAPLASTTIAVLRALGELPAKSTEGAIAARAGMRPHAARMCLVSATRRGLTVRSGFRYELTTAGAQIAGTTGGTTR